MAPTIMNLPNIMDDPAWFKRKNLDRENTTARYKSKGAPEWIIGITELGGGKAQGNLMEEHARYRFPMLQNRRTGRGQDWHDHTVLMKELFAEQKSSTNRGDNTKKFHWQHIAPSHPWSFLLLTGIDYDGIYYWAMSRDTFAKLLLENKITNQGSTNGDSTEGHWMWYNDIKDVLVPINNENDLNSFINSLNPETIPKAPPVPEKKVKEKKAKEPKVPKEPKAPKE